MATIVPENNATRADLDECQDEVDALRAALKTRPVIDQAKRILIGQHGCTPEEAFDLLSTASQRENRKVRDIAHAIVEGAQAG